MWKYILSFVFILLILGNNNILTAQIKLTPTDDAFVRGGTYASDNYGSDANLIVKQGSNESFFRKFYLQFNLLEKGLKSCTSAKIRIYASAVSQFAVTAYEADDSWSESTINWGNAPVLGAIIDTVILSTSNQYYEWDVTSYVQNQLAVDGIISVGFFDAGMTNQQATFNSKEVSENKPELIINTEDILDNIFAPSGLIVSGITESRINLSWRDNSLNEDGFIIERKTGDEVFTEITTTGSNMTSFNDTLLQSSTNYIYRVRAYNANDTSAYSEEVSVSTLSESISYYYIDNSEGDDSNTGISPEKAWKSLTKVNNTIFKPGDHILFKAGGVWTGRLWPKGSGDSGHPIVIDMYGTGNKPLFDGTGMLGTGVVYLYNQEYWEINNLEITNDAPEGGDRRGVRIEVENWGVADHIYLKNLYIHNIKGLIGQERSNKRTAGIGFATVSASTTTSRFNDILVEGCVIHSCDNEGIITECVANDSYYPGTAEWNKIKITNAAIRNNTIYDISKNAMIIRLFDGGVVEYNVCYNTAKGMTGNTIFSISCDGTVFQYNEGYQNHSPSYDGCLYDADLRSPRTIWQYSYSHDNAHGLFWTCTVQQDVDVVCRYNISQNDKGIIFSFCYPFNSVYCYNNTIYCGASTSPTIIGEATANGGTRTYYFNNNIIYNKSTSAKYDFKTPGSRRHIDYNVFYGNHPSTEPSDQHKITSDPLFVNPGSGGIGISTTDGYKLQSGSPCINAGKIITNNGGKDYWGNPLYNGAPDIGANEYQGTVSVESLNSRNGNGGIRLFPNPNNGDLLNLKSIGRDAISNATVSITDLQGKVIYKDQFNNSNKIEISFNDRLKRGVYFVSINSQDFNKTEKLIIK